MAPWLMPQSSVQWAFLQRVKKLYLKCKGAARSFTKPSPRWRILPGQLRICPVIEYAVLLVFPAPWHLPAPWTCSR